MHDEEVHARSPPLARQGDGSENNGVARRDQNQQHHQEADLGVLQHKQGDMFTVVWSLGSFLFNVTLVCCEVVSDVASGVLIGQR